MLGGDLVNVWKFATTSLSMQRVIDEAENAQSKSLEKQACRNLCKVHNQTRLPCLP